MAMPDALVTAIPLTIVPMGLAIAAGLIQLKSVMDQPQI
jgi:hypothetical protein